MGQAGHIDHTAGAGLLQQVQQTVGQKEVAQVVHPELHLKAVHGLPFWTHHDPWKQTGY